jgi:hypothetical protein
MVCPACRTSLSGSARVQTCLASWRLCTCRRHLDLRARRPDKTTAPCGAVRPVQRTGGVVVSITRARQSMCRGAPWALLTYATRFCQRLSQTRPAVSSTSALASGADSGRLRPLDGRTWRTRRASTPADIATTSSTWPTPRTRTGTCPDHGTGRVLPDRGSAGQRPAGSRAGGRLI